VGPGVARTETFRQKKVQRFDADYLFKVREHSVGRNRAVAQLLGILSFMRNCGAIPEGARVDWDRAHVQAIRGDSASSAAHNLPCQVLIDGHFPWLLALGPDFNEQYIISELRSVFGAVYVAPAVFNSADSFAEANCLRGALVSACAKVIKESNPVRREAGVWRRGVGVNYGEIELRTSDVADPNAGIDTGIAEKAFRHWLTESSAAFARAAKVVQEDGASSMGKDVTEDVLYILERYESAALSAAVPSIGSWAQMEQGFWRKRP
jgi:hypothetical protein